MLVESRLPTSARLEHSDVAILAVMAEFYESVKAALGKDPWVTASKLCARKRPDLFPVRDTLVRDLLGLTAERNYQVDWQVFRELMRDGAVSNRLADCVTKATDSKGAHGPVRVDPHPLRWLDVVLWMHARHGRG